MTQQSDLERFAPALVLHRRLQAQMLDEEVEFIVPEGTFDGLTRAYGVPVRHLPGLDAIYVAHRVTDLGWRIPGEFDKDGAT